jgi:hypothetical protein
MHSARVVFRSWLFAICSLLIAYCLPAIALATVGLLFLTPKNTFAQTTAQTQLPPKALNSFNNSSVDSNVERTHHNYVQIVTIELMASLLCQMTGIDPVDTTKPCLGVNPKTQKIGYAPTPVGNSPQVGGLLGTLSGMIAYTYQPMASTAVYANYLSDNFGIVKKAYAGHGGSCDPKAVGYGFCGLMPIFHLWEAVRNIAYALLVLALTFIGIGVMLRVKIDPRTVMSIQNQIPKVIVCIILITFSYAISAILVDLMWTTTYAGVNLIVNANPEIRDLNVGGETIGEKASKQLLEIPIVYVNSIFRTDNPGIFHLTNQVANFIGDLISDIVKAIMGVDADNESCFRFGVPPKIDVGQCVANALGFLAKLAANLIIFFVFLIALFKLWFNLLKAYVFTLLYIIISPVYIVFGLLPNKPLGFESWLRRFFANIAIFPLTAYILVGARVLMDVYSRGAPEQFIPPLIGHNAGSNFGALLALGAILIAPSLQTILREKMGVKQIGSPGIVAAGMAAGAAVVGAPVGRAMKHLNRYDARTGDVGALAKLKRRAGEKGISALANIPGVKGSAERALKQRKLIETQGSVYGRDEESGRYVNLVEKSSSKKKGSSETGTSSQPKRRRWKRKGGNNNNSGGGESGPPPSS